MTEQELIKIGFEKESTDEGSHYYTFDIGGMTFITNQCSDEVKDDNWTVDVFDNNTFVISSAIDMLELITILERNLKK